MSSINSLADFDSHIDLLTMSPAISDFRDSLTKYRKRKITFSEHPLKALQEYYGIEWVPFRDRYSEGDKEITLMDKAFLIRDMTGFVTRNPNILPASSIRSFITALQNAASIAEYAEADLDGTIVTDPRWRVCDLASVALAELAEKFSTQYGERRSVTKQAITALFELGLHNHCNFYLRIESQDTGIIGYTYLKRLISLANIPETAPVMAEVLSERDWRNEREYEYAVSLDRCSNLYAQLGGHMKVSLLDGAFDLQRLIGVLVEGLKIEKPETFQVGVIVELLGGLIYSHGQTPLADQYLGLVEHLIAKESGSNHQEYLRENLPVSGPIVLMALKRSYALLQPYHPKPQQLATAENH